MNVSTGTAAPSELVVGGVAYRARPLTYADIGEFERWAQEQHINEQKRLLELSGLNGEAGERLLLGAIKLAGNLSMAGGDEESQAVMDRLCTSLAGVTRLIWMTLRRDQTNLKLDDVAELLANPADLEQATEAFSSLNQDGGAEGKAPRTKKVRKTKSR